MLTKQIMCFAREERDVMQTRVMREVYDDKEKVVSEERDIKQT